jgi:IS5 family transposase
VLRAGDHAARRTNRRHAPTLGSRRQNARHAGYEISPRVRKRVEEIFGWAKTVACFRKTRFRGRARTQLAAHFLAAAYNLLRISRMKPA